MGLEHYEFRQKIKQNKELLKNLATLLTNEIQKRKIREPVELDFRFLLPLAQWLCEQGGYTITPKGNNPGNVMGKGDAGVFHRANNTEIVDGKPKNVPANFANYSTMEIGTAATFEHLKNHWIDTYNQILEGGSPEKYVAGLYPGPGKNYATQFQNVYLSGVRHRLKYIIEDFILVYEDDLKNFKAPSPISIPCEDLISPEQCINPKVPDYMQRELDAVADYNRNLETSKNKEIAILEAKITELKVIQKRFNERVALQPNALANTQGF